MGKAELDWECHRLGTQQFTNLLILETGRPSKLLPDEHPPAPPGARLDVIISRQTLPAGVDIRGLPLLEIEQQEYEQPAGNSRLLRDRLTAAGVVPSAATLQVGSDAGRPEGTAADVSG